MHVLQKKEDVSQDTELSSLGRRSYIFMLVPNLASMTKYDPARLAKCAIQELMSIFNSLCLRPGTLQPVTEVPTRP